MELRQWDQFQILRVVLKAIGLKLSRAGWICRSKEFGTVSAVNNKIIMKITNRYNMELGRGWPYR